MKKTCLLLFLLLPYNLLAQVERDTIIHLDPVGITAFELGGEELEKPVNVAKLDSRQLQAYDNTSLLPALNIIPGVSMDSRGHGGSTRLSIRGSALRSPFGVRNVKVYYDGIPLTGADGATPIELIDPAMVGSVEVIKGPAGSLYGAGTGGAMLFGTNFLSDTLQRAGKGLYLDNRTTVGSYGLFRTATKATLRSERLTLSSAFIVQDYAGYREQEFNKKAQVELKADYQLTDRQHIGLHYIHFDGKWGLPGSLNRENAVSDPRQAVDFSVKGNASVDKVTDLLAISHGIAWGHLWANQTLAYFTTTDKVNPYGTNAFYNGYKDEEIGEGGMRSVFKKTFLTERSRVRLTFGGELQRQRDRLKESSNELGRPGELKENSVTHASTALGFAQINAEFQTGTSVTFGNSLNWYGYDYEPAIGANEKLGFEPTYLPRIALMQRIGQTVSLQAAISQGFSPPTLFEVINSDGSISPDLMPEKGTNYEVGMNAALHDRVNATLSYYNFQLDDAILPQVDSLGLATFKNSGQTKQEGVELTIMAQFGKSGTAGFGGSLLFSGAWQQYEFQDYMKEGVTFDGKFLPGIPNFTSSQQANLHYQGNKGDKIGLNLTHRWQDEVALNDANTHFGDGYHVVDARGDFALRTIEVGADNKLTLGSFVGVNNLTDSEYTSFWQFNDARQRFYNPAAGRNFYSGINIALSLR